VQKQVNAFGVKLPQEVQEVDERSAEPIDRPGGNHVDLAAGDRLHDGLKAGALIAALGPRDPVGLKSTGAGPVIVERYEQLRAAEAALANNPISWGGKPDAEVGIGAKRFLTDAEVGIGVPTDFLALKEALDRTQQAGRRDVWFSTAAVFIPPIIMLALGAGLVWVGRGFRP